MNVLHISTFDGGGAGIAAIRLHNALLGSGVDSRFMCQYPSHPNCCPEYHIHPFNTEPLPYRILSKLGLPVTLNQKYWKKLKSHEGAFEVATLPFSPIDITKHPLVKEADIIHLHFISYFVDIPTFFKRSDKPVIWTVHDMFHFLGCFHYMRDYEKNKDTLGQIDRELRAIKAEAYAGSSHPPVIVSPSAWLMEISRQQPATRDLHHFHIFNSADTDAFRLRDRNSLRRELGLPEDRLIFLFVSENLSNSRKGFDLLLDALTDDRFGDCLFISVGKDTGKVNIPNYQSLGKIDDPESIARVYATADAFVLPSREDNLPNTMLESLCSGTPVISFPVGGIPEVVKDGINGILAQEVTAKSLADALWRFSESKETFDCREIARNAVDLFAPTVQAGKYLDIYQQLMA